VWQSRARLSEYAGNLARLDEACEGFLIEHAHSQRERLVVLAPRIVAHDDERGLLRDAAGYLRSKGLEASPASSRV